eukprot:COSAG02_NODE_630_length_19310_cov_19.127271_13_plen_127_part_00
MVEYKYYVALLIHALHAGGLVRKACRHALHASSGARARDISYACIDACARAVPPRFSRSVLRDSRPAGATPSPLLARPTDRQTDRRRALIDVEGLLAGWHTAVVRAEALACERRLGRAHDRRAYVR